MKNNRIESLLDLLSSSPSDPFLQYALGIEFLTIGEVVKAKSYFENLVSNHPDYVATYYHYAKLMWAEGNLEAAVSLVQSGIEIAKAAGDRHAQSELNVLLEEMED